MAPSNNTRLVLAERPTKDIVPGVTFRQEKVPVEQPGSEQVLVKIHWLSLDPAMRGWLNDARSYLPPVQIGEVMRAAGLGTVVAVGDGAPFAVGDLVHGVLGWQEYALLNMKQVEKLVPPPGVIPMDFLGALGTSGLTAYFGLLDVGQIKKGDTLVVSGAAGSVGSIACQIGKMKGAKVIAIAGADDKCKWLESLGVDLALNYKSPTFYQDCKQFGYLDVYFDNVGGEMLDFMLTRLNKGARIALCGAISDYNKKPDGLKGYLNLISQRAKLEGFIVMDYAQKYQSARSEMAGWLADGSLQRKFQVIEGLENAPEGLLSLFRGANTGKLLVQVSDVEKSKL